MMEAHEFIGHENPVWRDRANFIIHARLPEPNRPKRFEQLWTRQHGDNQFEVCCIPFSAPALALGDVVATTPLGDLTWVVDRVTTPSGRYVFRVRFARTSRPVSEISAELAALGSLLEWSPCQMLAVNAADQEHARAVTGFLTERERAGQLTYEAVLPGADAGAAP